MKITSSCIATMGLSLVAASNLYASYTYLKPNVAEAGPADIFADLFGGQFAQRGLDYTNGTVDAIRVADENDQFWTGTFSVNVIGRFSGFTQSFGSLSRGKFQELVEAGGIGLNRSGIHKSVTLDNGVWVRYGDSGTHSSAPAYNEDERDHLITYQIDANAASPLWVLFWEDLDLDSTLTKGRSVSDFNDLVVSVRAADIPGPPIAVPLPPALGVGLATMALGGYFVRKRNASR